MTLKLQFDSSLEYQKKAIASVVELFDGQQRKASEFTVVSPQFFLSSQKEMPEAVGNSLMLSENDMLENLRMVQMRNGIAPSENIGSGLDFDIEMETGTGKTYVYLRSLLELNKVYGFTKFIIVVPNLAIKEGVWKSIEILREHFANIYDHLPYDAFVYDSEKLSEVWSFATSSTVQIMVINIDAFRRSFTDPGSESKANVIHRPNDRLNGKKPIELIAGTNPVVVIDEPQSVDTTPKSKEAIASLNPLAIFRYSATHVEHHHLIYKLDAKDSYEMQLVKQIEVQSFSTKNANNEAYLCLKSVNYKTSPITARLEMDVRGKSGVSRKIVTVKQGDDLYDKSNGRDVYDGFLINDIGGKPGSEYLNFTEKPVVLHLGQTYGAVDDRTLKENQIKETIRAHLDKELRLLRLGIKVLSLFFIDKVANYRVYDENGQPQPGPYAKMFETCYCKLIEEEKYKEIRGRFHGNAPIDACVVHNGYFSIDKKGHVKDTSGKTQDDDDAYTLIMKDKERLLSLDTPLRFIFSHSALREGWDNPNVFQICTLNETVSSVKKRQEIGRGLRLCVDQNGIRQHGFEINTLTVMANESYEEFANRLQKEYEEDGVRFGVLEPDDFATIPVTAPDGKIQPLGIKDSKVIYDFFLDKKYVDVHGVIKDEMRSALAEKNLQLPQNAEAYRCEIEAIVAKAAGKLNIRKKEKRTTLKPKKEVLDSREFKELWDRIKWKTTYRVDFNSHELVTKIANRIESEIKVCGPKLVLAKALIKISDASIETTEIDFGRNETINNNTPLPDIVTYLQNETNLTRKSIVDALIESKSLHLFKKNPQTYMDKVVKIIRDVMQEMIVDGIKYTKIGDDAYYAQELFEKKELNGYLDQNMVKSKKSIYDYTVYDSEIERKFAQAFDNNNSIELYAKLPDWFKIDTPLGSYNPDWAIVVNDVNSSKRLYLIVETKGSIASKDLRPTENAKIKCGESHFAALGTEIVFDKTNDFHDLMTEISDESEDITN